MMLKIPEVLQNIINHKKLDENMPYKYDYAISLGLFCDIAGNLKYYGKRKFSSPFDWMLTYSFSGIMELINNHFDDFLNLNYIKRNNLFNNGFSNLKYNLVFMHDFTPELPLTEQIEEVKIKYQRRIDRFYKALTKKILFVRYVDHDEQGKNELKYINDNFDYIMNTIKSFNKGSDILFIVNSDLKDIPIENFINNVYFIEKDPGDVVCRQPFTKHPDLCKYLEDVKSELSDEEYDWLDIRPEEDIITIK